MLFLVHYNRYGSQKLIQLALDLGQLLRRGMLNARLAGIDGETGSIEAGKAADLIVCAKDPLADLSALRTLSMVIKGGYRVEHPTPKKLPEVERELDKFL